jgi:hypothetical protein
MMERGCGTAGKRRKENQMDGSSSKPQALKRESILKGLAARLKSWPSQKAAGNGVVSAARQRRAPPITIYEIDSTD